MKFHYIASQADGRVTEGELEARGSAEVLQFLAGKGWRPVSIKVLKAYDIGGTKVFGQTISISDKVFLSRYLALMLKAGTDLFRAIDILINDFDKPILKALLIEIKTNLEKGNPFYTTFAKYPKYFSVTFVNLIKAGEASGNLTEVLDNLSVSLGKEQELKNKVQGALIYPIILLVMSFLMLILLVTFALPKIANIFISSGIRPPIFSRIVFGVGLFLNANALIIFPLLAAVAVGGWYFINSYLGKKTLSFLSARLPVIKNVSKQLALQRFTSTLASLMKSGLPIIESLEITADAVGSEKMRDSLRRIAREGIAKGLTIGEAFRREPEFPLVVTNLIAVSERAGHIEEILKTLSLFYESEVDSALKVLVAFIEPILLLFIGVMIGTIAVSVIVPIYQLVGGI
ncbi:MAG: type II secretion system F family protein [Candidatus Harrisonbacteria bacterium]|nr:type II secretion system F family protein [Candidatus Harrisonbacteria bacterium]